MGLTTTNAQKTTACNMNILQQISVTGNLIKQVPKKDFAKFLGIINPFTCIKQ